MRPGIRKFLGRQKRRYRLAADSIQMKASPERDALLLCHALEKGMGMPNPRKGFGQEKARKLIEALKKLEAAGKQKEYAFREGLAVLKAYCEYQEKDGVAIPEISAEAGALYAKYPSASRGGYAVIGGDTLKKGMETDFKAFVESRHSMRTYSKEPVSEEEILRAVSMARKCPSACNRQPWKFYYSTDPQRCGPVRDAIPPQAFLEGIPYFGVVTVDRTLFGETETNQWYINGGIFLGFLSLAFHSLGIGSCIFQYTMFSKTEPALRSAMKIPGDEVIIAAVGFGKYPEEARCIIADRRENEDIAVSIKS